MNCNFVVQFKQKLQPCNFIISSTTICSFNPNAKKLPSAKKSLVSVTQRFPASMFESVAASWNPLFDSSRWNFVFNSLNSCQLVSLSNFSLDWTIALCPFFGRRIIENCSSFCTRRTYHLSFGFTGFSSVLMSRLLLLVFCVSQQ